MKEPASSTGDITPRTTPYFFGHAQAEETLISAYQSEKLPHAWIISGARGIGKATLAYRFARFVLAGGEHIGAKHPVFKRMVAGSHTDLLVIEPQYDEKKEERKAEITVEDARKIAGFLSMTAGEGAWRVVIVDSADELNTNAANAILKILEEPPPRSLLLLISHNPSALLPTIRSRARMLALGALNVSDYMKVMGYITDSKETSVKNMGAIARYSPGVAAEWLAQGMLEQYAAFIALVSHIPNIPSSQIIKFSEQFTGKQPHAQWRLFRQVLHIFFERLITGASDEVAAGEKAARGRLLESKPVAEWIADWREMQEDLIRAEKLHLDYKTVTYQFFETLSQQKTYA